MVISPLGGKLLLFQAAVPSLGEHRAPLLILIRKIRKGNVISFV